MLIEDLHLLDYRQAWTHQEIVHAQVADGAEERILLVEHPPVITLGRRPDSPANILASAEALKSLGIDIVHSDRGGDITFHGPGQLVAYPIIRLNDHVLSVGAYVRALENSVIAALSELGLNAQRLSGAVGVWCGEAKICAIGVRIRRGVSMHGLALNVQTDLSGFNLIVPCGLPDKAVTSMTEIMGDDAPAMPRVKAALVQSLRRTFAPIESLA